MLLKADQQRVTALLTETVTLLCKNGLHFKSQFKIEGLIGITLDQEDIFLVNINETVAVEGAVREDDGANSPLPIDGRSTASKKRRLRQTPAESSTGVSSEPSQPSAKPTTVTASKESYVAVHHDNSSTSDHRSCSPVQPASVKSQSEDAGLARPGSPMPSSSGKASETNASDRVVSFCDVPIKLDYALSSRDAAISASDGRHANEPASKRPRRHVPSQASDAALGHEQNSMEPAGFDMPSGSGSCKMEPSDIIEIKEESLSDDEMKESIAGYSSYADYSSATATYGNSDLDASQMYGETSGFQPDTMFQGDMQASTGLRSHENPPAQDLQGAALNECTDCRLLFANPVALERHMMLDIHRLPGFACPVCGKVYDRQRELRGHVSAKHDTLKHFACPFCTKRFSYKRGLRTHLASAHKQHYVLMCSVCGFGVNTAHQYQEHMVSRHGLPRKPSN